MTVSFFILAFYLTELVVNKPHVVSNYKDVIDAEDMTVVFSALTYDVQEKNCAKNFGKSFRIPMLYGTSGRTWTALLESSRKHLNVGWFSFRKRQE